MVKMCVWSFHQVSLLFGAQISFKLTERSVTLHKTNNRLADWLVSLMESYLIKTRKPNTLFSVFVTRSSYFKKTNERISAAWKAQLLSTRKFLSRAQKIDMGPDGL